MGDAGRLALALLAAVTPAQARAQGLESDRAGNRLARFEAAEAVPADDGGAGRPALHCDGGRLWCAQLRRTGDGEAWQLHVSRRPRPGVQPALFVYPVPPGSNGDETVALWPRIILETEGTAIMGVERRASMSFSGGGSSAVTLLLFRAGGPDDRPEPVLNLVVGGSGLYRSCYFEGDERRRAGACSTRLEFSSRLLLDRGVEAGPPRLVLTTRARTWPGVQRLGEEDRRSYRRSDLVWAADPACSYRRLFSFSESEGRYLPDRPLPTCDDYFNV